MSIEIRNISPPDNALDVSVSTNILFDIVALDGKLINIGTLSVSIETNSNIDGDTHTTNYTVANTSVVKYSGTNVYYSVLLNLDRPFDESMSVTVKIDIQDTLAASMTQFSSSFTTLSKGLISDFRYAFIDFAQKIPVYNEILKKNSTTSPTVFDSAFQSWNLKPVPRIQVNQVISTTGYTIDYENGLVTFNTALDYNDVVEVTYQFAFFTDEQINSFFKQANAYYYNSPPQGGSTSIYGAGEMIQMSIMIGAASFAFREILFSLAFQEKRIIFDNASWGDGWTQIKDLLRGLYESYSKDWDKLLEAKKLKLPSISSIISPEYTLPGGRSRMFRYLYKGGAMG